MLRNILFPFALILFWSCGPDAGGKSMKLNRSTKNNYSEGNFQEGFWVEDFSLQVIEEGDLNFNVGWSYLKTIVKNGEPKLIIKNPVEEIHYDLHYVDSCFSVVDKNDSTYLNEQIHFKDSEKIIFGAFAETVPY